MCYAINMFKEIRLNKSVLNNIDALAEAYNRRNKTLFKQCLFSLEMDLAAYYNETKKKHQAEDALIKWYEKLWEF